MDKYQTYFYKTAKKDLHIYANGKSDQMIYGKLDEPKISFKQLEDIHITKYTAFFLMPSAEKVFVTLADDSEIECATSEKFGKQSFVFDLDFENRIKFIRIKIKDNIVDDIVLPVEFIEADKEKYYAKIAAEKRANLLKKASFSVATGESLINIRFQPVSDDFSYAKVELMDDSKLLLGKYKSEPDIFFVTIKDLAFGKYYLIVKQYNEKGEELVASDEMAVVLSRTHYGGKPIIMPV